MCLFKVNTGTREQEVCQLRWEWEIVVPGLGTSVFLIPEMVVKDKSERLVVLNDVAHSVVQSGRGHHPEFVFCYRGHPVRRMNNSAWRRSWRAAGLPSGKQWRRGVHNLKHTFGRRLRAAGVSNETRKALLGHKNGDITTHYSAPELQELIDASNKVVTPAHSGKSPALILLRSNAA